MRRRRAIRLIPRSWVGRAQGKMGHRIETAADYIEVRFDRDTTKFQQRLESAIGGIDMALCWLSGGHDPEAEQDGDRIVAICRDCWAYFPDARLLSKAEAERSSEPGFFSDWQTGFTMD